ncbi:MAG: alpha/beta fold hydrolase [Polyangiales bacterium]
MTASVFALGRFKLHHGGELADAKLVYSTHGTLNDARSNVILYPTSYGAQHTDIEWLVGPILDPSRFFIVIPNMLGNGLSTSPSHLPEGTPFEVDHIDNVVAQERLLRSLGVETIALAYGWSMGAQQALHWAVMHPERVRRVAALCGTARTREHNIVFLSSLESALHADPCWDGVRFTDVPSRGLRAFARIYASWAASQAFYRHQLYKPLGFTDLEDYLVRAWEPVYRRRHPLDLLAMLRTWMRNDVARGQPLSQALGRIRARTLIMPSQTDLYFTPEDCADDAALIPGARYREIPSIWGHRAGNPSQNPSDARFIRAAIEQLLEEP